MLNPDFTEDDEIVVDVEPEPVEITLKAKYREGAHYKGIHRKK